TAGGGRRRDGRQRHAAARLPRPPALAERFGLRPGCPPVRLAPQAGLHPAPRRPPSPAGEGGLGLSRPTVFRAVGPPVQRRPGERAELSRVSGPPPASDRRDGGFPESRRPPVRA